MEIPTNKQGILIITEKTERWYSFNDIDSILIIQDPITGNIDISLESSIANNTKSAIKNKPLIEAKKIMAAQKIEEPEESEEQKYLRKIIETQPSNPIQYYISLCKNKTWVRPRNLNKETFKKKFELHESILKEKRRFDAAIECIKFSIESGVSPKTIQTYFSEFRRANKYAKLNNGAIDPNVTTAVTYFLS